MLQIPRHLFANASVSPFRSASLVITMAPQQSTVVEYAKSNRSSCKVCSNTIESKVLRLGLVSKDNRGYVITKWHHIRCFPLRSHPTPDTITGFSSLKRSDQEELKKLFAEHDKTDEVHNETGDIQNEHQETEERNSTKRKVGKATEDIQNEQQETEENEAKRRELCTSDIKAGVDIIFSVSDVKSKYQDATLLPKWKAFQTVIFLERDDGLHDSSKIAAFDFDGCLAKTAVNRVGANAWSLMYPSIPDKLQSLYNSGYKLVIFTNESNIERWKNKRQVAVDSKIGRLNNFIEKVKVPIQVFIACGIGKSGKAVTKGDDPFRKPKSGMWKLMEQHFNSGITIDMDQSFYVGDAAGRESDHSDADIKFAEKMEAKVAALETKTANLEVSLKEMQNQSADNQEKIISLLSLSKGKNTESYSETSKNSDLHGDALDEFCLSVKKVELPMFTGEDPAGWIARAEVYFRVQNTHPEIKVSLAQLCMDGATIHFFKGLLEEKEELAWGELKFALLERYGGVSDGNIFEQLSALRQEGRVEDYIEEFERLIAQIPRLPTDQYVGYFVHGLKANICGKVHSLIALGSVSRPKLMNLARAIERETKEGTRDWCSLSI